MVLQLPKAEKLMVMEALWQDLCQDADTVVSPAWHEGVLAERETLVREGAATFLTVEEARAELLKRRNG